MSALLLLLLACSADPPEPADAPIAPPPPPQDERCPQGMALIAGADGDYCIHSYEVAVTSPLGSKDQADIWPSAAISRVTLLSAAGHQPTKGVSWYQAVSACKAAGLALCTSEQWQDACDGTPGPGGRDHPTLDGELGPSTCNIRFPGSKEPALTGSHPSCRTPTGVFDLEGNVWEWTDPGQTDQAGLPVTDKRGGGHYSGDIATCDKAAVATHPPDFDGTIGFRCCTPAK